MKKKRFRLKMSLILTSVVVGILLTVLTFPIPFTVYNYNGFANSIKLGIDLKGGVSAVYNVDELENSVDFSADVNATILRLQSLLANEGYTEATVVRQMSGNQTQIRVEVPDVDDPEQIFELIGRPRRLEIRDVEDETAPTLLTGDNIQEVFATMQGGTYGVSVTFDDEGTSIFSDITTALAGTGDSLYIYIGGELFSKPTVSNPITNGRTFISGSMNSFQEAQDFAMELLSGTFAVDLELYESSVISPTLGIQALRYGIIAGLISLIAIFIFLIFTYGRFGVMASLSLLIYLILLMFFLQALPPVQLTLPGIAGIILSLGMAVDANIIIFERIKQEYIMGKGVKSSVDYGFDKATSAIVDANITTIIASIVLYILGTGPIQGFATTLLIGIVLSMFASLVITKWFIKNLVLYSNSDSKAYRLKREDSINESNS